MRSCCPRWYSSAPRRPPASSPVSTSGPTPPASCGPARTRWPRCAPESTASTPISRPKTPRGALRPLGVHVVRSVELAQIGRPVPGREELLHRGVAVVAEFLQPGPADPEIEHPDVGGVDADRAHLDPRLRQLGMVVADQDKSEEHTSE